MVSSLTGSRVNDSHGGWWQVSLSGVGLIADSVGGEQSVREMPVHGTLSSASFTPTLPSSGFVVAPRNLPLAILDVGCGGDMLSMATSCIADP